MAIDRIGVARRLAVIIPRGVAVVAFVMLAYVWAVHSNVLYNWNISA
jgi:hypothetical protein